MALRECPAIAHYPDQTAISTGFLAPCQVARFSALTTQTTLVACEFDGGVVVGTDSRTSAGTYIVSRTTDKVTKVTDKIYVLRSGSAADSQALADIVAYRMEILKYVEEGGRDVSVWRAAQLFRQYCYDYRDDLMCSMLVVGVDDQLGGQVYAIPLGGLVMRQPATASGSGSTFLGGFMDSNWKKGMSRDEAEKLVLQAVSLAMERDGSSGGVCHIGCLTGEGMTRKLFSTEDKTLPTWEFPQTYEETVHV